MEAGLPLNGLPDLSAKAERDGFYRARRVREGMKITFVGAVPVS